MKYRNFILLIFVFALALLACRGNDDELQKIDQVLQIYVKNSAGQDLLNSKIPGSFKSATLTDIGGLYDQSSISGYSIKKDNDTVNFIEYKAGATRYLKDSVSPDHKFYQSDLQARYITAKKDTIRDTISILYSWTPQVFQVQTVKYNRTTVFTKTDGAPNVIKIVK